MKKMEFGSVTMVSSSRRQMEMLCDEFKQYNGARCVCIDSAAAALYRLPKMSRVDVLLLDWLGIEMDIFEFLEKVRQIPSCVNTKIIVCGPGNKCANIRESLLSNGADYYMIKPYQTKTLFKCIRALCAPGHFPETTVWDVYILKLLENQGLSRGDVGYWYMGSALQQWLTYNDIPQLKVVYSKVSQQFGVSAKGVESGLGRAIRRIAQMKELDHVPTCKEWLDDAAKQIWKEYDRKRQRDNYGKQEQGGPFTAAL